MSFGSLYKGKRLVKKIFFPRMFIIDFLPHLYREVLFFFVWKAPIGIQKWASVERRTKTHWTKQLSKNTWILIISWKTGVLGVNKAKNLKILKKKIFFRKIFPFFYFTNPFFSQNNDTRWSYLRWFGPKKIILAKYKFWIFEYLKFALPAHARILKKKIKLFFQMLRYWHMQFFY